MRCGPPPPAPIMTCRRGAGGGLNIGMRGPFAYDRSPRRTRFKALQTHRVVRVGRAADDAIQIDRFEWRVAQGARQQLLGHKEVALDLVDQLVGRATNIKDPAELRDILIQGFGDCRLPEGRVLAFGSLEPSADAFGVQLWTASAVSKCGDCVRAGGEEGRVFSLARTDAVLVGEDAHDVVVQFTVIITEGARSPREDEVRADVHDLCFGRVATVLRDPRDTIVRFLKAGPDRIHNVGDTTLANHVILQAHPEQELGGALVHRNDPLRGGGIGARDL